MFHMIVLADITAPYVSVIYKSKVYFSPPLVKNCVLRVVPSVLAVNLHIDL